ncbi:alpha-amylase family protein [Pseudanabaena sp. FACHB-2040]|uniref:alpha-amylase family protein n=1 Tax=Pseudanabaena sp. FACHB-2040 TaxID=2692859 RepID=UPI0016891FAD|nr:alpha-amylase family protein [Pseudanabaena sp. FACHB-2040]MBD2259608.1 alpha-amylase family protein [Pseudanabaena sp. FACHB-2040]
MRTHWYKNAIFYSLNVETFFDSNGDGIGDFPGLTQKLDYIASLGTTCLWLLPFYPSPNRDNGYDVMDYYNVSPRLGTLGDFGEFMVQAKERGIRVLIDMVINHTSVEHPWFQSSRSDPNSPYRNYYIWVDTPPDPDKVAQKDVAFPGVEDSIWEYDEAAQAYYLHHFYKEQPDLNFTNPEVREEICKIMGFWLALGVSGFRIDAAPYMLETPGLEDVEPEKLKGFYKEMRSFVTNRCSDAILLAEANEPPEKIPMFFGEGDRMHVLFNFLLNQYMFLALAREDANTLKEGFKLLPEIPADAHWLNFVRHHDELTLDQLTEAERQEIFKVFAPQENMQIYGRGIRRRLPPMVENDRRRLELIYSLLFSLPGIPMLRYGEEIGMGDDLSLQGRGSVRTPMQWANEENGGFSTGSADQLASPMISSGDYGYQQVNVACQQLDPNSLLNWIERATRMRKQAMEFGWGQPEVIEADEPCVFAHCCYQKDKAMLAVHNLSGKPCTATLKANHLSHLVDFFSDRTYDPVSDHSISLSPYGYRWFKVKRQP